MSLANKDADPKRVVLVSETTIHACDSDARPGGMIYKLEGTASVELIKEEVTPSGELTGLKETLLKVTEASAEWKVISEDICNDTSAGARYQYFRVRDSII